MTDARDPIDAADSLLAYLEDDAAVAYAEVGAVDRRRETATVTSTDVRTPDAVDATGVWCRVFADGSADYRFTSVLADDHLFDVADRAIRAARTLAQRDPSSYDPETVHRAIHRGWSTGPGVDESDALERLEDAMEPLRSVSADGRLDYQRNRLDLSVLTTTGSAVRTALDRGSVTVSAAPGGGPRLRRHVGTTTGPDVLDRLPSATDSLVDAVERLEALPTADPMPSASREVLLGPPAAGQLIHFLSRYFEMDTVYSGAAPFDRGDRIAPPSLTIHDVVRPGSWAAVAYDMEARPTHPVTLVDGGVAATHLHSVETAVEEDASPSGSLAVPIGFEHAPRIHPRHLEVDPGDSSLESLQCGAAARIDRFERGVSANAATRAKRTSGAPASALYARNANRHTPAEYDETRQSLRLDVREGYALDDGERAGALDGATVEFDVADLRSISGLSERRETVTGVCNKHKAMFPFAVTAPAIRLSTTIESR